VARVTIRTATLADHGDVRDVRRRASLSNEGDRANLLANPETLEYDTAPLLEGRTRVAVADGRIVGFATTDGTDELEALFVDPLAMRMGVARSLVDDLVDHCRATCIARINVIANPHALAFYEAVGFVADGLVPTRFGPGHRMHLDVV
jgi:GNAT superfamily N-acetyltransferase